MTEEKYIDIQNAVLQVLNEIYIVEYWLRGMHPNIVQHLETTDFPPCIVMPQWSVKSYIKGQHQEEIKEFPIETFCRDMAFALDYLHMNNVVHNDVHPGNIMLQEDLTPILIDFGLAQILCTPIANPIACCRTVQQAEETLAYKPTTLLGHGIHRL